MGAWLKFFTDGSRERGADQEIAIGKASWSLGRLDNIKEVRLSNTNRVCSLSVPNTSWHQFDRFSVIVSEGTPKPTKTHQVVQAEIISQHIGLSLICSETGGHYSWTIVEDLKNIDKKYFFCKMLKKHHVGKWLTVILPYKDYPGITFSTKGKMYDNKHISR